MSDTIELKPCPFCGGEAVLDATVSCFFVQCIGCAAEGPWHDTMAGAVRGWDKRPADTVKERLAEALTFIIRYADSEPDGGTYVGMHRANIERARVALASHREEVAP